MKRAILSILFLMLGICAMQAQAPLRPGDTFEIRLSGMAADDAAPFNGSYTIDDQGMINLPLVRQIKVAGLLPGQIQEAIQNRLMSEKIFTHPTVTIQNNAPRLVNVMGEVKSPQRVNFTSDMTLMTAINACGGFSDFADKKRILLTRDGKTIQYSAPEIAKNPASDPKVLPGDQINVKAGMF
jgi:polysaccharide export outer membrane protein